MPFLHLPGGLGGKSVNNHLTNAKQRSPETSILTAVAYLHKLQLIASYLKSTTNIYHTQEVSYSQKKLKKPMTEINSNELD